MFYYLQNKIWRMEKMLVNPRQLHVAPEKVTVTENIVFKIVFCWCVQCEIPGKNQNQNKVLICLIIKQ